MLGRPWSSPGWVLIFHKTPTCWWVFGEGLYWRPCWNLALRCQSAPCGRDAGICHGRWWVAVTHKNACCGSHGSLVLEFHGHLGVLGCVNTRCVQTIYRLHRSVKLVCHWMRPVRSCPLLEDWRNPSSGPRRRQFSTRICLNDITHQKVMRFNQRSKFANIFQVHLKHPQCFGTLAQPSHFLSNTPVMAQRIFTGPTRVEWLWVNDFGPNEYHIWHGWSSACWHVENKSPKYEVPIFTAQTCNQWRKSKGCAKVPKNGLPNWSD